MINIFAVNLTYTQIEISEKNLQSKHQLPLFGGLSAHRP